METNITEKTIAMRNGTEKMKRDREYWSDEEREKLRSLFLAGVPINESLGQSHGNVPQKALRDGRFQMVMFCLQR